MTIFASIAALLLPMTKTRVEWRAYFLEHFAWLQSCDQAALIDLIDRLMMNKSATTDKKISSSSQIVAKLHYYTFTLLTAVTATELYTGRQHQTQHHFH